MKWSEKFQDKKSWWRTYSDYLNSKEWKRKRDKALKRDKGCRICNFQYELQVHHRCYDRVGDEDMDDLTVLCRNCHKSVTSIMRRRRKKPNMTIFDNVISVPELASE